MQNDKKLVWITEYVVRYYDGNDRVSRFLDEPIVITDPSLDWIKAEIASKMFEIDTRYSYTKQNPGPDGSYCYLWVGPITQVTIHQQIDIVSNSFDDTCLEEFVSGTYHGDLLIKRREDEKAAKIERMAQVKAAEAARKLEMDRATYEKLKKQFEGE